MKKLLPLFFALMAIASEARAQTFTVTAGAATYSTSGGQILFTVNLTYPSDATSVAISAKPPGAGWSYVATGGTNIPAVAPKFGDTYNPSDPNSKLSWAYSNIPVGGASFTFILKYPLDGAAPANTTVDFTGEVRHGTETPLAVAVPSSTLNLSATPIAGAIVYQPQDIVQNTGDAATFLVGTTGAPAPTVQWQRSTDGGTNWSDLANDSTFSGVNTAQLKVAALTLAMNGNKFRAVVGGTLNSSAATATVLEVPTAPTITKQPLGLVVLAGDTGSFSVTATGTAPLSYQWSYTPAGGASQSLSDQSGKRSGTQAATLTISNIQAADAGDYVCLVTNGMGNVTSSAASLSIAPRIVKVVSQTAAPNTSIVVPVQLRANGAENALGFSLSFDPAILTYQSVAVGANASDASLNPNVAQAAAGKIGVALAKPANVVWGAGTQEIVKVTFTVAAGATDGAVANIAFGDSPIPREISSAAAAELPGTYQAGSVTIFSGYECDFNNDGRVSITEWVKVGRIVAGLDAAAPGTEFMKADCAPRLNADSTLRLGNGVLSITDWVQAGRYAAGLDPVTPAGGPAGP